MSKIRTLGEQIRRARIEKGLTQKQLADLLGVKNNSISDWEKGKSKPHVDIIELLMGVLDIDYFTLNIIEHTFTAINHLHCFDIFRQVSVLSDVDFRRNMGKNF